MSETHGERWRHQESDSAHPGGQSSTGGFRNTYHERFRKADSTEASLGTLPLNAGTAAPAKYSEEYAYANHTVHGANGSTTTGGENPLEILCGPLLNYKSMSNVEGELAWHGSVLIVTRPRQAQPTLTLTRADRVYPRAREQQGVNGRAKNGAAESLHPPTHQGEGVAGVKLYEDPSKAFWRFELSLALVDEEARWQYSIPNMQFPSGTPSSTARSFVVPARNSSFRIMFHSCNGFSVGTDEDAWSGPALWADVLRMHEQKPFHVMIGGGDQIYNDGVRVAEGPLRPWTEIALPKHRREFLFGDELRLECDKFYFENYATWYSTGQFAVTNGQIPQINVWDDHDIIDGFGSYTDHFMNSPVFKGIGEISFKYYCLFQLQIPPPTATYTTSGILKTQPVGPEGVRLTPLHLKESFARLESPDPYFILGDRHGPYIEERSRNIYMQLGARIAFLGIDARTERTRHQVNYPETYDLIFQRVSKELSASPSINHLILLLGVPIAYPRLDWLENVLRSPLVAPIRLLNKRFGIAGGFFNHFDGAIEILDDLDDHYTSRQHKHERKDLLLRLQALAVDHSVRITILGGDVHLAATGRFYSNTKLEVPIERDFRYMANVISSAITNKPPPKAIANLMARRNKIHHLDHDTDETLMPLFDRDPGNNNKTAAYNNVTMPSRNYAIISEADRAHENRLIGAHENGSPQPYPLSTRTMAKNGHSPLHAGEINAGTTHTVASAMHSGEFPGGLDISIRVEIDQHDPEGRTEGYGFSIPVLLVGEREEKAL